MILRSLLIFSPLKIEIVPFSVGENVMVAPHGALAIASRKEQSTASQLKSSVSSNLLTVRRTGVGVIVGVALFASPAAASYAPISQTEFPSLLPSRGRVVPR